MSILNTIKNTQAIIASTTNTTNEATTMTTQTTQDTTGINLLNTNALSSTISAQLFLLMQDTQQAVVLGCAVTRAIEFVRSNGKEDKFLLATQTFAKAANIGTVHVQPGPINTAILEAKAQAKEAGTYYAPSKEDMLAARKEKGTRTETELDVEMNDELVAATLGKLKMVNLDGTMGSVLVEMVEQRKELYAPTKVGTEFTRRFKLMGLEKGQLKQASGLAVEAIEAQEASQFTVDTYILSVATQAQTMLDDLGKLDNEGYVLAGCKAMSSEDAYTSEFKFDNRLRAYQAACHGPNGQSSDRSRALMNLHGVEYTAAQVPMITKHIMAEIEDMTGSMTTSKGVVLSLEKWIAMSVAQPVEFIVSQVKLDKGQRAITKPWSFLKAAKALTELAAGNMPYIGMAVGLDAKCSGPQYGALMVHDEQVSAACGFTLESQLEDAYQRCIAILDESEFNGMSRGGIKKTFMGVFYGQGFAAFMNTEQLKKDEQYELVEMLLAGNTFVSEERAKQFHKLVTSSFGKQMVWVRNQVSKFNNNVEGRMGHFMPDGAKVQMNYKIKHNILNEVVGMDTVCPDVLVTINGQEFKFINMALKTKEVDSNSFVRTAFVNMIQAVDALIARLIVVHLSRLGAKHIVGVHDCFRVNVTEMHLLEQAIKNAYMDVFGGDENTLTTDLPMGKDILGMFFDGLEAAKVGDAQTDRMNQFCPVLGRYATHINGVSVDELIQKLGETYYFAK